MHLIFARLVRKDLGASFHGFYPYSLLSHKETPSFCLESIITHLYACHLHSEQLYDRARILHSVCCCASCVKYSTLHGSFFGFCRARAPSTAPKIQRICPSLLQEVARLPMKKRNRIDSPFNALTSKLQTSNMPHSTVFKRCFLLSPILKEVLSMSNEKSRKSSYSHSCNGVTQEFDSAVLPGDVVCFSPRKMLDDLKQRMVQSKSFESTDVIRRMSSDSF